MYLQTITLLCSLCCILYYADGSQSCPSIQGVYPSLDSCLTYSRCFLGRPFIFYCRNGDVYDHTMKSCGKSSKCHTFTCTPGAKYALYTGDPSMYALCEKEIASEIKQCPEGLAFDISKEICSFKCTRIGIFPHVSDCTSYIECPFSGIWLYKKCPANSWFDSSKMICTSSQTEKCKSFPSLTTTKENWKKKKKIIQTSTNPTSPPSTYITPSYDLTSDFSTYETPSENYKYSTISDETLENAVSDEIFDPSTFIDNEIKSTYEEVVPASHSSISNILAFTTQLIIIIIVNLLLF